MYDWPDAPEDMLLEYVLANHRGFGAHPVPGYPDDPTGASNKPDQIPNEFVEHCKDVIEIMGYRPCDRWRYWCSIIRMEQKQAEDPWAQGFPHTHGWDGLTLVHYIQVPHKGGALVIRDHNREVIKKFTPEVGKTAVIDGRTEHGVERVYGDVPRVTVIATGYFD